MDKIPTKSFPSSNITLTCFTSNAASACLFASTAIQQTPHGTPKLAWNNDFTKHAIGGINKNNVDESPSKILGSNKQ